MPNNFVLKMTFSKNCDKKSFQNLVTDERVGSVLGFTWITSTIISPIFNHFFPRLFVRFAMNSEPFPVGISFASL